MPPDSTYEQTLLGWIAEDAFRMQLLETANRLQLPDWCIAAGFVRNLAWDKLHGYPASALADIDLIYFDPLDASKGRDTEIEARLREKLPQQPWSVRNQARMHLHNGDARYTSTLDAMRHWVELETAVGVRLSLSGALELIAPFGLGSLFARLITANPLCGDARAFYRRVAAKDWLHTWPQLQIAMQGETPTDPGPAWEPYNHQLLLRGS